MARSFEVTSQGESVVRFVLRRNYQLDAAAIIQSPSVQLGDNLLYCFRHGLEIPFASLTFIGRPS